MSTVQQTEIIITNSDTNYRIPGDWNAAAVVAGYSAQIPGLGNMISEEQIVTRDGVTIREVTFKPRVGNKG